jgi:hypothetical protein
VSGPIAYRSWIELERYSGLTNPITSVLLGSFSNYLVTKSSIPVMVARRKLKKHAKYKNANIRLSNNLINPKKLATAKID